MKSRNYLFALALLSLGTQSATAGSFNFSGNLSQDDSVQFLTFILTSPSVVEIDTTSYTLDHGFTPVLSLWNAAGTSFGSVAGNNSDALWNVDLSYNAPDPTGVYYLAVSENPNAAGGVNLPFLADGNPDTSIFSKNGLNNYTGQASTGTCYTDQSGGFYQTDPNPLSVTGCIQTSSVWRLNVSGTGVSSVGLYTATSTTAPEPAALILILAGLAGMASFIHRRPA